MITSTLKHLVGFGPKSAPAAKAPKLDLFERAVADAQSAVSLPEGYFEDVDGNRDAAFHDVSIESSVRTIFSQSPIYHIMAGCHSSYSPEIQEKLWSDYRYRQAVAHVLRNVKSCAEVFSACNRIKNKDYNGPMIATLRRAIKEDLVGLNRRLVDGCRWEYYN